MSDPEPTMSGRLLRLRLPLILLAALVLRVALALDGGQYFFGDEARHTRGLELYLALADGRWEVVRAVVSMHEHAAFTWLVAALGPAQHALASLRGLGDWRDPGVLYASAGLGAALLAGLAVSGIALVHRLARAGGAGENEALLAAGLMAASNTLFYSARHLLPYDVALTAWLGSLVLLQRGGTRATVVSGLLAGLTYHLYNGYWFLVPITAGLALGWLPSSPPAWRRGAGWSLGTLAGLALPVAVGWLAGGAAYWTSLRAFSQTVVQGLFAEGWSLPWAFLWHSEQALGVLVLVAFAGALLTRERPPARVLQALALIGSACALLGLMSAQLERFVVYGRTVRPLVPLLCLAGGWALSRWMARRPRLGFIPGTVVGVLGLAALLPHFGRPFPRETELQVLATFGQPKHALSFRGSIYRPLLLPVVRPELALVDAQLLYPIRDHVGPPPGTELFSLPHPLAYGPYQYEAHTPRERGLLRRHPPRIRLVRLNQPESVPDHPPPAEVFAETDRPDGHDRGRR